MAEKKSAFDTPWFNAQGNDFFNSLNKSKVPHLLLTAETEDFDEEVTQQWKDEGFDTAYVPLLSGGNDFINRVHRTGDAFGVSEYYAIVAFGDAASLILEGHLKPNHPKLCAIIAYYPSSIPSVHTKFPPSVRVLAHLAGTEIGVRHNPEVLGIQGKRKTVRKRLYPGKGYGGSLDLAFPAYTYEGSEPGFAEHDLDEYDPVAEAVAFSRSLGTLQKAFRLETGAVEAARDALVSTTIAGGKDKTAKMLRPYGHVIYGPTLTGGVGGNDLVRFYGNFFSPFPPSFGSRLLSRTVGTDRVVDELFVSFTHSQVVPWLLPGIAATGKKIEIVLVSVMCVRGGKLESEHVYWDQASVLVQVGLLDPKLGVSEAMKKKGVKQLPVQGAESARAMKRGSSRQINDLIAEW